MNTQRLTVAQAVIAFLKNQHVSRDSRRQRFFAGCFGIFGHGNVGGVGQALQENPDFRYYQARNEQSMVHVAAGYAKMSNRMSTFVCTSSVGPGATNMVTAAAGATVNRLPVMLLPADVFARRNVAPVLQQLESPQTMDISVNDSLRPISRYWDRINRPEQLPYALMRAMQVLTSPADTGAVTLALPLDVQTEAWEYPVELFEERVWQIPRTRADYSLVREAAERIKASRKPLLVAGGGVIYSEATEALLQLVEKTGIPVGETHAGKGSLPWDHPQSLGAIGVAGTSAANQIARDADLVLAVGTRLADYPMASTTAFQNPDVRFVHLNVAELDAFKHGALPLIADAKVTLEELVDVLHEYQVTNEYAARTAQLRGEWMSESERQLNVRNGPPLAQSEVIGLVNKSSEPHDVVVCAAGSLPGDLNKLWRVSDPKGYHDERGYSCMGYEIAAGLGVKMAAPDREVYVMVGDGSYLMMPTEIITSIQEGYKIIVVLVNNHGFGSIARLSNSVGSGGFGSWFRYRDPESGQLDGDVLPIDLVRNAESLGAHTVRAESHQELEVALEEARCQERTTVVVVEVDAEERVPGYNSWWDVPVAETSEMESVRAARLDYEVGLKKEQHFF